MSYLSKLLSQVCIMTVESKIIKTRHIDVLLQEMSSMSMEEKDEYSRLLLEEMSTSSIEAMLLKRGIDINSETSVEYCFSCQPGDVPSDALAISDSCFVEITREDDERLKESFITYGYEYIDDDPSLSDILGKIKQGFEHINEGDDIACYRKYRYPDEIYGLKKDMKLTQLRKCILDRDRQGIINLCDKSVHLLSDISQSGTWGSDVADVLLDELIFIDDDRNFVVEMISDTVREAKKAIKVGTFCIRYRPDEKLPLFIIISTNKNGLIDFIHIIVDDDYIYS